MKREQKLPKSRVDTGQGKVTLEAIENHLHLQFPIRFELRQRTVGAFVLGMGKPKAEPDRFKFVFGFECRGVHTTLKESDRDPVFDAIEGGLKDLPKGETMTLHFGSFSSDRARQEQLSALLNEADLPQLKFLLEGEKKRVSALTKSGTRKPKFLKIYVTYTVEPSAVGASDHTEKLLSKALSYWHKFTGIHEEIVEHRFTEMFESAFTDGFLIWEQLLFTKMGLDVRPMLETELWAETWKRFNKSEVPPLPQLVTMTENIGIVEWMDSDLHPTTMLIESLERCPRPDRQWIYANGKYIGALNFLDKPAGWADKNAQLRYLWELFSRDRVFDTEVFCELSRANEQAIKDSMQLITKQSIVAAAYSSSRQSVDVQAELKRKKTIAAQESLYEGAVPLNVAVTLFVHRNSPERLDEACRYLQSCVRRPAWLDREVEYAWLLWFQSLPINWEMQQVKPFNRRLVYLTSEAPAFMSLVKPRELDRQGLELLSEEGGMPIHLDLFTQHRNLGLFATTRAGKSVMASAILTQALASGMPIVALDFPKPDGTSTFTDYTRFMGKAGAYFDIGTEANNLFELPDLRGMSLSDQQERMEDYKSFLEGALMTMVMGNAVDPMRRNAVRSLVVILLDLFFQDPAIMARYDLAFNGGFGSPQWQQMPTMRDFLPFCDLNRLQLEEMDDQTVQAMGMIKLQIRFWITSRVGKAISAPSSFPTDARLLVFALRNLNDESDAAVLALSAYSAALRRALASPKSIFFIDESPILFEFDDISALVARLFANGAKAGIRGIISAQDPDTIAKSPSSSKILQNMTTRLIGRIQPTAVASFVRILDYPVEVIGRNATESFFPNKAGLYSQWLLDDTGVYTYTRFYVSTYQLAAVANNTDEQACRNLFNRLHRNPYKALGAFSDYLVECLQSGGNLDSDKLAEDLGLTKDAVLHSGSSAVKLSSKAKTSQKPPVNTEKQPRQKVEV